MGIQEAQIINMLAALSEQAGDFVDDLARKGISKQANLVRFNGVGDYVDVIFRDFANMNPGTVPDKIS